MSSISVCKDCPDRQIGCHSTCERYKEQSEQRRKEQEEIRRQRDIDNAQTKRMIESHIRMKRRRKH